MIEHLRHQLHILSLNLELLRERYKARRCACQCCDQHKWGMHDAANLNDVEAQGHWRRVRSIMRELRNETG